MFLLVLKMFKFGLNFRQFCLPSIFDENAPYAPYSCVESGLPKHHRGREQSLHGAAAPLTSDRRQPLFRLLCALA
jgi:hypothetical protein